ncbi:MAG: peptidoglycan DD-metalloendopeptidase family protein [Patescibacteria group bacterium]
MPKRFKLILGILLFSLCGSFIFFGREIKGAVSSQSASTEVNEEVRNINRQIEEKKNKLKEIEETQSAYSQAIKNKQGERADLNNQLAIIDNREKKAELDIMGTQVEIDRVLLEIEKTGLEIKEKEEIINEKKEHISKIIRMVYKKDDTSILEILLLNDSFSEFLNEVKYLEDINSEIKDTIEALKSDKIALEADRTALGAKNKELEKQKEALENKKLALAAEYDNKNILLEQTRSSEAEYQRLLALAKREQASAAADIAGLERTAREKLAKLDAGKLELLDSAMIWPVPRNVITASFHDPDYPFRYIFEHPAIDVRAGQGTSIRAVASGYVARAKNSGMGYSYIMLIHGDGLSSVYGHVSKIYVEEDEYVTQGQVIGASGGMPGTPGAGNLTTGPHLHFETRLNGIPVNPLDYLP